jgi:hypothetical protein
MARKCENQSRNVRKELCERLFRNSTSPLRKCFAIVKPEPFMEMCLNDLCDSNNVADIESVPCASAAAYVNECKMSNVPVPLPNKCVSCQKPFGGIFHKNEKISLSGAEMTVPNSADVVVVVEEKMCNRNSARALPGLVRKLESEFKRNGLEGNRFGLVGYGGEGVHSKEHTHTIDSELFNKARKFLLGSDSLVFSRHTENNDTLRAVLAAAQYPFRSGVAKNIILLTCSQCRESESTISYSHMLTKLREQGITLHVLTNNNFNVKKTGKTALVYGFDVKSVYTSKDINNPFGSKEFRHFIEGDDNRCYHLAQQTNGTVFDSNMINEKSFPDVFCPRMVHTSKPSPCQECECVADKYEVGTPICRPCQEPMIPTILELSEQGPVYQFEDKATNIAMKKLKLEAIIKRLK